jgi:hypothetical protein
LRFNNAQKVYVQEPNFYVQERDPERILLKTPKAEAQTIRLPTSAKTSHERVKQKHAST